MNTTELFQDTPSMKIKTKLKEFIDHYPHEEVLMIQKGTTDSFNSCWATFYKKISPVLLWAVNNYTKIGKTNKESLLDVHTACFISFLINNFGKEWLSGKIPTLSVNQLIDLLPKLITTLYAL
jgi:hypothetical protein